jgi:hypothetical protein
MESYVRIGREAFEKSSIRLNGGRGVKNCQNHAYVINEWPLTRPKTFKVLFKILLLVCNVTSKNSYILEKF